MVLLHAIEKTSAPMTENFSGAIGLGARSSLMEEMASLDAQRSKVSLQLGKELLGHAQELAKKKAAHPLKKFSAMVVSSKLFVTGNQNHA